MKRFLVIAVVLPLLLALGSCRPSVSDDVSNAGQTSGSTNVSSGQTAPIPFEPIRLVSAWDFDDEFAAFWPEDASYAVAMPPNPYPVPDAVADNLISSPWIITCGIGSFRFPDTYTLPGYGDFERVIENQASFYLHVSIEVSYGRNHIAHEAVVNADNAPGDDYVRVSPEYLDCMVLQGYWKRDLAQEGAVIDLGAQTYSAQQLQPHIIYEDSDVVVYDLFPLLSPISFEESLAAYEPFWGYPQGYSHKWLVALKDYLITAIPDCIQPV